MTDPLAPAIAVSLEGLHSKVYPILSPGSRETLAVIGLRRARSLARRHRRPQRLSRQDIVRDLVKGLISAREPGPELVRPLATDYECVAETILLAVEADGDPVMAIDPDFVAAAAKDQHATRWCVAPGLSRRGRTPQADNRRDRPPPGRCRPGCRHWMD